MRAISATGVVFLGLLLVAEFVYAEAPRQGGLAVFPISGDSETLSLGSQLSASLSREALVRVVPPTAVGDETSGDVEARTVRKLARDAGVDAVVTGRVERQADDFQLEVALRSGHSGALISEFRVELAGKEASAASLDSLADAILASLGYDRVDVPSVAAGEAPEKKDASSDADRRVGRKGSPLSIASEELEVTEQDDRGRRLVFEGKVRVVKGDILLEADRLEAFYPKGSSRPAQLEATGSVQVTQGERQARCEHATYDSGKDRVSCRGRAELSQGCETVRGSEIEFDLAEERVRVLGSASVVLEDDPNDAECGGAAS